MLPHKSCMQVSFATYVYWPRWKSNQILIIAFAVNFVRLRGNFIPSVALYYWAAMPLSADMGMWTQTSSLPLHCSVLCMFLTQLFACLSPPASGHSAGQDRGREILPNFLFLYFLSLQPIHPLGDIYYIADFSCSYFWLCLHCIVLQFVYISRMS